MIPPSLKVLVIEDDHTQAGALCRLLQQKLPPGSLIVHSPLLTTALERLSAEHFDVAVVDLSLPDSEGGETVRAVRALSEDIAIIVLTGSEEDAVVQSAIVGGADDYFVKGEVPGTALVRTISYAAKQKRLSDEKYRNIFDEAILGIYQMSLTGRFITMNPALAAYYGYGSPNDLLESVTDTGAQLFIGPGQFAQMLQLLEAEGEVHDFDVEQHRKDGSRVWLSLDARVVRDPQGRALYYTGFAQDITERKVAEAALEASQRRILEASRRAGMAEVATNVLHNVGNVLNSVTVSVSLLRDRLRDSRLPNLARATALLRESKESLAAARETRGEEVIQYLFNLSAHLVEEQASMRSEVEALTSHIADITTITAMQQRYATSFGVAETVRLEELVEDALRISAAGLVRHGVEVERRFAPTPLLSTERHQVLQVLVNLISNAKDALDARNDDRRLMVRIEAADPGYVAIAVIDNGSGIPADRLPKIFESGFSTRHGGHGFGLHGSALAAREIGGTLTASSEGSGCGATFTLRLPLPPFSEALSAKSKRLPFITPRVFGRLRP